MENNTQDNQKNDQQKAGVVKQGEAETGKLNSVEQVLDKKSILIIDDDFAIRELIESLFMDDEQYVVLKAETSKDGLNILEMQHIDLILLDIMMPQMDGYEFCRKVRNVSKNKHIPIIILTAKHQQADVQEGIKAGADEYITKPFDLDMLKKRIEVHLLYRELLPEEDQLFNYQGTLHYVRGR